MTKLTLYYFVASPASRAVLLIVRYLGLHVDLKVVNLLLREHLRPDFARICPQRCVPVLRDGEFTVWEAKAIALYLVESKSPGNRLYPDDLGRQTVINQRLFFDANTLAPRVAAITDPVLEGSATSVPEEKRHALHEAFAWLNGFLDGQRWLTGAEVSVADLCIFASVSAIVAAGAGVDRFPNIVRWLGTCESLPGYKESMQGAKVFGDIVKGRLSEPLEER